MAREESETVEFKKSLAELKDGLISIAAMLNKHGHGDLWFGIRNDGHVVGIEATEKTLRDVSQAIAAHIEPRIFPQIGIEKVDVVPCIKVACKGKDRPYFAYGRAHMRVADEDRQLTARELENLILLKNREALRWDSEASMLALAKIDEKKLKRFVEQAGLKWDSKKNVLEKFGLLKEGFLVNAALLFFGKAPPIQLRCAVFAATDSATIIDRHDFDGDILELIEEAQKYLLKNIHIGMRLKGLYREDVPEISVDAMREAIINAFCHRDYRDPDYVQVAIFKDRVEIRNPGGLFGGLTIEKMVKGHISKRRNPLVADLLRRIHMVEAWGRGMPLILKNAPRAKFTEIADIFIASFERPSFSSNSEQGRPESGVWVEGASETSLKTSLKTSQKRSQKTSQKILVLIRSNPEITIDQMSRELGITDRNIKRNLAKLKAQGLIERVGPDKGGIWKICGG